MANTNTNTRIMAGVKHVTQYLVIDSDGTEETGLVIYDSSAVATVNGRNDPLTCKILRVRGFVAGTGDSTRIDLVWDADTDVVAIGLPTNDTFDLDFCDFGGLQNPAGTGITGDILVKTAGLAAGDNVTIILDVDPSY